MENYQVAERVVMIPPLQEVPHHGSWNLSYSVRYHNPQDATSQSKYGLKWLYEEDEQWTWFGLSGDHLLTPNTAVDQPSSADDLAPWMFIDNIRIAPSPQENSLYYPGRGAGRLCEEEMQLEEVRYP